jgi:hypothetical protein
MKIKKWAIAKRIENALDGNEYSTLDAAVNDLEYYELCCKVFSIEIEVVEIGTVIVKK